ncbi:MAG: S41 family peptidase [Pyrinomonadaceae bacterium]
MTVQAETSSLKQRLEVFDDVWQTIEERYYDANLHGVNWLAQREIYRAQAASAADNSELYRVLKLMVGSLHDSHTRVSAPEEKSDWRRPRLISVGVSIREIEGELVFTNVDKNSLANRSGIRIGDVLRSVDGVSAASILQQRVSEQSGASTTRIARLKAAAGIFEGADNSFVRVGFERASDKSARFAVLKREWRVLPASINARRAGATLIITFDSFSPEIVRDFFQILGTQMRGVRGIVLDLRANRGGSTEAMTDIASAFLPENQILGKFIDRVGKIEVEASTRRLLLYSASAVKIPKLPIVILTSTATASAAEILTAVLKTAHHVRTIGTPTCGCVLAVKGQHTLPDGGSLEISELDFQMPDGSRLEGTGVAVDEKIPPTRRDLLARRDSALERAIETVKS